ncbi:MAG: hypothetical protein V2A62_03755 [Candidatus Woesearchaeota archaeon]
MALYSETFGRYIELEHYKVDIPRGIGGIKVIVDLEVLQSLFSIYHLEINYQKISEGISKIPEMIQTPRGLYLPEQKRTNEYDFKIASGSLEEVTVSPGDFRNKREFSWKNANHIAKHRINPLVAEKAKNIAFLVREELKREQRETEKVRDKDKYIPFLNALANVSKSKK